MTPYLQSEVDDDDDEFGDVEDEDLRLAESANLAPTRTSTKRTIPSDFDGDSSSKKVKADNDSASIALARQILQATWGFADFRLKQQQAITRLITGGSAVVVFPTGGGKSLVYQVPALAFDYYDKHCGRKVGGGLTLVVSPLIALMKDQVDALKKRGVSAAAMDSSQSRDAWLETCEKLRKDDLKLL